MSEGFVVRRARAEDREQIGELWQEMMEFHAACDPRFFQLRPEAREIWLRHFDESVGDGKHDILVAEAAGELVGLAMGREGEDPPVFSTPPHGFVVNFVVAEGWRRKGVGERLCGALLEGFEKRGLREARLSVAALNPASNAFWRKMGFEAYSVSMRRWVGG